MVLHTELYLFITLSVTLTLLQCRIVKYVKQVINISLFFYFRTYSREMIDVFPDLTKTFLLAFHRHCSSEVSAKIALL